MTQQLRILLFIGLIIFAPASLGASEAPTSGADLVLRVEAFLWDEVADAYPNTKDVKITVRPPDARLTLENCQNAELALHGNDQVRHRVLVRATCTASYAIHLSATIEVHEQVVVTSQALTRKQLIGKGDLDFSTVNVLTNQRQYLTELEQVVGNTLTRSVRSGTPLTAGMIKAPDLVTRGDSVVIVASRGEISVRMPGIAMMTGSLDEQINVRNQSSDRVVKGWVRGPGEVHVPF